MKLNLFIVDAFADKAFSGNPAGVCPLSEWLPDALMQQIAMENNQAETAFVVNEPQGYRIRWFTPVVEVDLCGHATLAAAHVMFTHLNFTGKVIRFNSRSGVLTVSKEDSLLALNFPADELQPVDGVQQLAASLNIKPVKAFKGKTDYMFIYQSEDEILQLKPDFRELVKIPARGLIVTAPGNSVDFVSRFFAPQSGIDEDPVTGSAHTSLIPYWSKQLGKTALSAMQLSARRGSLQCMYLGDRVNISGKAITYLQGEINV